MESQIRYLATVSERPQALADFYCRYFSMRELERSPAGDIGAIKERLRQFAPAAELHEAHGQF